MLILPVWPQKVKGIVSPSSFEIDLGNRVQELARTTDRPLKSPFLKPPPVYYNLKIAENSTLMNVAIILKHYRVSLSFLWL